MVTINDLTQNVLSFQRELNFRSNGSSTIVTTVVCYTQYLKTRFLSIVNSEDICKDFYRNISFLKYLLQFNSSLNLYLNITEYAIR